MKRLTTFLAISALLVGSACTDSLPTSTSTSSSINRPEVSRQTLPKDCPGCVFGLQEFTPTGNRVDLPFSATPGACTLKIDGNGDESAALVWVNDLLVVDEDDLVGDVLTHGFPVTLRSQNTLGVMVLSGSVTIWIDCTPPTTSPRVTFTNYCTVGPLVNCATVYVQTMNGHFGTRMIIRIKNLEGTSPQDNNPGAIIGGVSVRFPGGGSNYEQFFIDDEGGISAGGEGVGFIGYPWMEDWYGNDGFSFIIASGGIAGCHPPALTPDDLDNPLIGLVLTCRSAGYGGGYAVTLGTPLKLDWNTNNMQVSWGFTSYPPAAGLTGASSTCHPDVDCFAMSEN